MFWDEWDDTEVLYRVSNRDGIDSPEWFNPSVYEKTLAHDIVHHVIYENCGYGLDPRADANANELIASGVILASGHREGQLAVSNALSSFLAEMPLYLKDTKDYWSSIKPLRKSEWRDKCIEKYAERYNYGGDRLYDTSLSSAMIRALSLVKRGHNLAQSMGAIEDTRRCIESTLISYRMEVEEKNYPLIYLSYDTNRAICTVEYEEREEDIGAWYGDCDAC
jgi:hypothetical protein